MRMEKITEENRILLARAAEPKNAIQGYAIGFDDGYKMGFEDGEWRGHTKGVAEGYEAGYEKGVKER